MPRFEVQSHEVSMTSATSGGYAPRINIQSVCSTSGTSAKIWLYFEPVPALYGSKGGIGFGKSGETDAKYWIYLDQATFDEVSAALDVGSPAQICLQERTHPGAAGANRLVTDVELAFTPQRKSLSFPSACTALFAAI